MTKNKTTEDTIKHAPGSWVADEPEGFKIRIAAGRLGTIAHVYYYSVAELMVAAPGMQARIEMLEVQKASLVRGLVKAANVLHGDGHNAQVSAIRLRIEKNK